MGAVVENSSSLVCEEDDTEPVTGIRGTAGRAEEGKVGTMSRLRMEEKFFTGQYRTIDSIPD